ncbi:MAG: ABC transporter permease [Candidatus Krumholzibacteriota bacterium]|nr:ABC transporter permease [Candidatus Krumholzibacteriota bacterium]
MTSLLPVIQLRDLPLVFAPVLIVVWIHFRWSLGGGGALYAVGRMILQLFAVGYILAYIFGLESPGLITVVLTFMLIVASWIAIRPIREGRSGVYLRTLGAIAIGGIPTLILVAAGVMRADPWYTPRFLIPLAGMIFANAMNTTSLAIERLHSELERGTSYEQARRDALRAALIPLTNSLLAVGIVSFPGMMTGQILSGVSPVIAARYQIVVMAMLFGSSGIAAACYLTFARSRANPERSPQV